MPYHTRRGSRVFPSALSPVVLVSLLLLCVPNSRAAASRFPPATPSSVAGRRDGGGVPILGWIARRIAPGALSEKKYRASLEMRIREMETELRAARAQSEELRVRAATAGDGGRRAAVGAARGIKEEMEGLRRIILTLTEAKKELEELLESERARAEEAERNLGEEIKRTAEAEKQIESERKRAEEIEKRARSELEKLRGQLMERTRKELENLAAEADRRLRAEVSAAREEMTLEAKISKDAMVEEAARKVKEEREKGEEAVEAEKAKMRMLVKAMAEKAKAEKEKAKSEKDKAKVLKAKASGSGGENGKDGAVKGGVGSTKIRSAGAKTGRPVTTNSAVNSRAGRPPPQSKRK